MAGGQRPSTFDPELWKDVEADEVDVKIYKRISLGSGPRSHNPSGYVTVDKNAAVEPDVLWDLAVFQWPFEDSSIHEIWCSHYLEHCHQPIDFFNEVQRIAADKCLVHVLGPYWNHEDAYSDPTHVFRITKGFFKYLSVPGRVSLGVEQYGEFMKMDIDTVGFTHAIEPSPWECLADDSQSFAVKHYANVVKSFEATLIVNKPMRRREDVVAR